MYLSLSFHASPYSVVVFSPPSIPSAHPSLSSPTADLFTVSAVLPLPECHVVGSIQRVAFSDGFLRRNVHLRLLRVFSRLDSSFLFSADGCSIVRMCHTSSIRR